jgi:hypothetical protein
MNSTTTPNKISIASSSNENVQWTWHAQESPSSNDDVSKSGENQQLNKSFDSATQSSSRRGRPKSELLTTLMLQGSTSPSAIKCKFCNRVFPRDKSLSAHQRIHTGKKIYSLTKVIRRL